MTAAVAASVEADAVVPTVVALHAAVALAYGALLLALSEAPGLDTAKGAFPQPVMLGFFSVCGVGMLSSALELVWGEAPSTRLLLGGESGMRLKAALAVTFGLANRLSTRWIKHYIVLPASLAIQLLLFYAGVALTSDLEQARADGWLWQPFPPLRLDGLQVAKVDWGVVAGQSASIASLLVMLVLDLLTTLLPIELMTPEKSTRMRSEFRITGCASALSGAALGSVSYVSLSPTRMNVEAGGVHRVSGLASAAICGLWMLFGMPLTALVPKVVVGGLLMHLAFGYLLDGLWESRALLSTGEHAVVLSILLYYFATDLAPAIIMGFVLCCFSFVLRYSQSSALSLVTSARDASMYSHCPRSSEDKRYLRTHDEIVVARTSCSHLFFGSIASILADLSPMLSGGRFRFLLFDFSSVRSLDSSALVGFRKLPAGLQVVAVGLRPDLEEKVRRAGLPVCAFGSLDEGLEWCEDRLLGFAHLQAGRAVDARSLLLAPQSNNPRAPGRDCPPLTREEIAAALARAFRDSGLESLVDFFQPVSAKRHEVVFEEGDAAEGMFVIVSGALQVYYGSHRSLILGQGEVVLDGLVKRRFGRKATLSGGPEQLGGGRGRSLAPGSVVCEAALFVPHRHGWSLVATSLSQLLLLTRDRLLALEQQQPRAALRLHRALLVLQHASAGGGPADDRQDCLSPPARQRLFSV
ncbi:unnamed protein product [Prorocentrum cordatum]|uniref:Sulfate transporter n=1 Tax=Prorocentrum cordatum TaxID=2364126 RepID=A0ABN9QMP8_9DINO|nr:unnamed protein product [Polarella glacialis]